MDKFHEKNRINKFFSNSKEIIVKLAVNYSRERPFYILKKRFNPVKKGGIYDKMCQKNRKELEKF